MNLLIAVGTTGAAVTFIYLSWLRRSPGGGWSRLAALAGWLLVCVAACAALLFVR